MVLNRVTHLYLLISLHLKSQNVEIHNFIKRTIRIFSNSRWIQFRGSTVILLITHNIRIKFIPTLTASLSTN